MIPAPCGNRGNEDCRGINEMDKHTERALSECYRLIEETGDAQACLERYPELAKEIEDYLRVRRIIAAASPSTPRPAARDAGQRLLLSALARGQHGGHTMFPRLSPFRLAGALAGLTLAAGLAVGAGAATGGVSAPAPVNSLLSKVGITHTASHGGSSHGEEAETPTLGAHGGAVSDAVHDAQATATPGPGRGQAVSEAACEEAHDRSTLPEGAQAAPGQEGRSPKDCTHPNADGTPGAGKGNAQQSQASPKAEETATPEADETPGPDEDGGPRGQHVPHPDATSVPAEGHGSRSEDNGLSAPHGPPADRP